MCTVLLRFAPGTRWPVLAGAVRDEFFQRSWDPPAAHWPDFGPLVGGRDRTAGGTWLAVDSRGPRFAALLNGPVRLPLPDDGARPSRGELPLRILTGDGPPPAARYDSFHLVRAGLDRVEVWSWAGDRLDHRLLPPGDHVIVNDGVDAASDPLVPVSLAALAGARTPNPRPGPPTAEAWGDWVELMTGGDLDPTDPRALLIRREFDGLVYGSTSVTLVALAEEGLRYDFRAVSDPWAEIKT
jgi:Transport and Golgi organisation 2